MEVWRIQEELDVMAAHLGEAAVSREFLERHAEALLNYIRASRAADEVPHPATRAEGAPVRARFGRADGGSPRRRTA